MKQDHVFIKNPSAKSILMENPLRKTQTHNTLTNTHQCISPKIKWYQVFIKNPSAKSFLMENPDRKSIHV